MTNGLAKFKPQYPGGEYAPKSAPRHYFDRLKLQELQEQQELSMEEQADFAKFGMDQGQPRGLAQANAHKLRTAFGGSPVSNALVQGGVTYGLMSAAAPKAAAAAAPAAGAGAMSAAAASAGIMATAALIQGAQAKSARIYEAKVREFENQRTGKINAIREGQRSQERALGLIADIHRESGMGTYS